MKKMKFLNSYVYTFYKIRLLLNNLGMNTAIKWLIFEAIAALFWGTSHEFCVVLQMASQILRNGCLDDDGHEGIRRVEPAP